MTLWDLCASVVSLIARRIFTTETRRNHRDTKKCKLGLQHDAVDRCGRPSRFIWRKLRGVISIPGYFSALCADGLVTSLQSARQRAALDSLCCASDHRAAWQPCRVSSARALRCIAWSAEFICRGDNYFPNA